MNRNLAKWRRCKAVLEYIGGKPVKEIAKNLDAARCSVYVWLDWYNKLGVAGLESEKSTGRPPILTDEQKEKLIRVIESGPLVGGYQSGVWTGSMIGDWIRKLLPWPLPQPSLFPFIIKG